MALSKQDESKLIATLESYRSRSNNKTSGDTGHDVATAWDYYYGRLPLQYCEGGSKFVSRDVWEAVNGTLQDLTNVFLSNNSAVEFSPLHKEDALAAKAATAYVNETISGKNDGYRVLSDTLKECLVTRQGYVKRYWKEQETVEAEEFSGVSEQELEAIMQDSSYSLDEPEKGDDGTYSGNLYKTTDTSHVAIEFTPYEEVSTDPDAKTIADSTYFGHTRDYVAQDLIDMGFDKDLIRKGAYQASASLEGAEVTAARNPDEQSFYSLGNNGIGDENADRVWLHEEYILTTLGAKGSKNKKKARLLQVFSVGGILLESNEVDEIPFTVFTPYTTPASMWGESIFDITKDIQDIKTALTRGYIDNIMNANYGRYTAVTGQYDRKSLLHNVPGGIVEQKAPGMIDRFPYHQLPAGTDQLLETFEQTKERRTGVTRTSMGMNSDVLKNDNAFATVDAMMSAAQNRIRMVARNIAENGFKELFQGIYRIARQNEKQAAIVEVQGREVELKPSMWPVRSKLRTAVAIGSSEKKERSQNLMNLLNVFSQNPMLAGQSFQPTNANHVAKELAEALGFFDVDSYVTSIENIPQPQPDPVQQQKVQLELQKLQLENARAQAETQEISVKAQLEAAKIQLSKMQVQKEMAELQFTQERAADEMKQRQDDAAVGSSDKAINAARLDSEHGLKAREIQIKEKELQLKSQQITAEITLKQRELDLKEKELLLEAQLEATQGRPVGLGD